MKLFAQGALRRLIGFLKAKHEKRRAHIKRLLDKGLHGLCRLIREIALNGESIRRFQQPVRHFEHLVHRHIASNGKRHIVEVIKCAVAAVEKIRRNMRNRIDRSRDVDAHGVHLVERPEAVEHHLPVRLILIHSDFLPDDALLLLHGLFRKIRRLHKIQQNLQRRLKITRAGEKIAGALKRRIRIGGRACFA